MSVRIDYSRAYQMFADLMASINVAGRQGFIGEDTPNGANIHAKVTELRFVGRPRNGGNDSDIADMVATVQVTVTEEVQDTSTAAICTAAAWVASVLSFKGASANSHTLNTGAATVTIRDESDAANGKASATVEVAATIERTTGSTVADFTS